jgi:hypothetical protein
MTSYTKGHDGKEVSLAKRVCDMLKDPDHQFGVKSVRKSNKRAQGRKVRERYYQVMDYKNGLAKLPLPNTKFKTVGGFDTQTYVAPDEKHKKVTRNGTRTIASWEMNSVTLIVGNLWS